MKMIPRIPHRRKALLAGVLAAAAVAAILLATASAGTSSATSAPSPAHAKIKHVWLIILENKSYDATFTGLNKNTYLWQTLPSQGVLLKNYYGTGHFSLDNYISMVSGQATQPDTQADCPDYDSFSGSVDLKGSLALEPQLRADGVCGRAECRRRIERLRLPVERLDAVQPARRRARQLEGLRAGSRQSRRDVDRRARRPDARRRHGVLRRSVPGARRDRHHHAGQPGQRERDRPVRAEALPVPVVRVDPAVG